jgi:cellulose synthase/poly-beta-1,6-N-acetylglucosamine synthase-like glycosyltransferase
MSKSTPHIGAYLLPSMTLLLVCSGLFYALVQPLRLEIPIDFSSVYFGIRSVLSLIFFVFFLLLLVRHLALVLFSVADQIDRTLADRRLQAESEPFEPLISIIVPAFNEGVCIEASIRSLLTLNYPRYEVLVVDDGSTDDTLVRAKKMEGDYGHARVIVHWKPNGGKSSALNFGYERAAGDFCVTMDSDSALHPDSLKDAIRHFRDPDVAAVGGAVKVTNTISFWSRLQYLEYVKGLNLVRRAQGFIRAVSIVPGPIGVFRKSAVTEVGTYDHDTFAEDFDLTAKLLFEGWKVIYEPGAVAMTEAPEDLMALIKQRYRWTRGIVQVLRKHAGKLWRKREGAGVAKFMFWYMIFEGLFWPLMTVLSLIFLGLSGVDSSLRPVAAYLWIQLLILDVVTTLYSQAMEQEKLHYSLLGIVERLVFCTLLDIFRILATIEEFFGVKMSWGKLDRKGRT